MNRSLNLCKLNYTVSPQSNLAANLVRNIMYGASISNESVIMYCLAAATDHSIHDLKH